MGIFTSEATKIYKENIKFLEEHGVKGFLKRGDFIDFLNKNYYNIDFHKDRITLDVVNAYLIFKEYENIKTQNLKRNEENQKEFKKKSEIISQIKDDSEVIAYFKCQILETKSTVIGGREDTFETGIASLHPHHLTVTKKSIWRGKERGSRKIVYNQITSVDYDIAGTFGITNNIEVTMAGSAIIILRSGDKKDTENFYNKLNEMVYESHVQGNIPVNNNNSDASDLEKIMNMYKEGLLSDEEFSIMKKKIIEK